MFVLAAAAAVAACGPAIGAGAGANVSALEGLAYVYQCERDERFVVRVEADSVRLHRELLSTTLPQTRAASGTRYSAGGMTFWSRGLEARLETPADTLVACRGTPASTPWEVSRLLGYDFRAVGQEPGWVVEVDLDRRMHVLAEYGAVEFFTREPEMQAPAPGTTTYLADSPEGVVVLEVRSEPCQDIMSGEAFPKSVTLRLGGEEYEGCGGEAG